MGQGAEYISPRELAGRWGGAVTPGTLANWRCKGRGPAYVRFGHRVRYPLAMVEAWEAANLHLVGANDNERSHE